LNLDNILSVIKNGYFIGMLINRLEGKFESIRGMEQNPKGKASKRANWLRILEFLRKLSRFKCDVLYSLENIVDGDSISIFNILNSI
jgi:hypothetical protein